MKCCLILVIVSAAFLLQFNQAKADTVEFFTCDFDLDLDASNIARPIEDYPYPEQCNRLDDEMKQLLRTEAEQFKQFDKKLTEYESSLGRDTDDEIFKDWDFRKELYGDAELHTCHNSSEELRDYIECMKEKREVMITKLDEKMAEPK